MALTNVYLTEEALSLPPEQSQQLADLLLESLKINGPSDEEHKACCVLDWPICSPERIQG